MNNQRQRRGPDPGPGGHGPMGMSAGEKAKDFKGTFGKLVGYLKPFWFSVIIVLVFAVASTVFSIAGPKILGSATNKLVEGVMQQMAYDKVHQTLPEGVELPQGTTGAQLMEQMPQEMLDKLTDAQKNALMEVDLSVRPAIDFSAIGNILLFLLFLYCFSSLFSYVQGFIISGVSQKVAYRFREQISQKINKMPIKYFDTRTHGEVLSRVTNDVDTVSQTLNQSLSQLVTSVTTIIGVLAMMFSISWMMTLIALLILPVTMVFVSFIVKHSQKFFKGQQRELGRANGHIEEMYGGHLVMKAFNGEERSIEEFDGINKALYQYAWKSQFVSGMMQPILNFVSNIGYVGVCVLGGYLALRNTVQVGDIQAFIQYVRNFTQPITQTANMANILQSTMAAAERVFEFLDEAEEVPESEHPRTLKPVHGKVEFDHVMFGYSDERTIIKDFNAVIQPEQRVAIVGPTGAGKTTMVNLLMRFYDVNAGAIRIDGVDVRDMKRDDLRDMFGMVLQDTWLFHGTIRENIRYGRLDATDGEVLDAARAAQVDHFVRTLPEGYDFVLNEEANNVSQGQKQLLTIARAIVSRPSILILDEATSSVDTRTEVLIQKAMDNLMRGRTSFIIAHRLSTIRDADLILVMRDGNIVEQGKHQELLARNGFYAQLYQSQFEKSEE